MSRRPVREWSVSIWRAALRPAISNWRTTAADLDLFVEVVRELGAKAAEQVRAG